MAQKAYGFKHFIVLPYWANNLNKVMKSLYGVLWIRKVKPKFGHAWKYIAMSFNRFSLCTTIRLKAIKPSIEPIWKNRRKNNQWIRVRIKIDILFLVLFGCRKTAWALFGFCLIEFLFTFYFHFGGIFMPICYDCRSIGYASMSGDTIRIFIFY